MRKPVSVGVYLSIIIVLLSTLPALAWEGRVVDVADGDTSTVEPVQGGKRVKVRLYVIDCPESRQPYGQTAKGFVADVALYKAVDVDVSPAGRGPLLKNLYEAKSHLRDAMALRMARR